MVLSIAGSGRILQLERDCSGFPSIIPLFSTYASLIVVLLTRFSIFVVFFFKLGIQIQNPQIKHTDRGYHEVFMLLSSFLTFLFVELVQIELLSS